MKHLRYFLPITALLMSNWMNGSAIAGSFANDGSDDLSKEWLSAVFLGPEIIDWCIHDDGDLGISNDIVAAEIAASFEQWRQYLKGKGLDQPTPETLDLPTFVLNSKQQNRCDENTDLTFYLDYRDKEIQGWINRYANPVAFTRVRSYDDKRSFGNAYIWIRAGAANDGNAKYDAPDWSHRPNLRGMLLHEIGRLLGCRDIPGTIMAGDFGALIRSPRFPKSIREKRTEMSPEEYDLVRTIMLTNIDYSRELYFRPDTGITLYSIEEVTEKPDIAKVFESLLGFAPRDSSIYQKFIQYTGADDQGLLRASMQITDGVGIDKAIKNKNLNDPEFAVLDFEFHFPTRTNQRTLSENMIFRRHFVGFTVPEFNPSTTYDGVLKRVKHRGVVKEVNLGVRYTRNIGRFNLPGAWDKALIRIELLDQNNRAQLLFEPRFDEQLEHPDGFFAIPGGKYKIRAKNF